MHFNIFLLIKFLFTYIENTISSSYSLTMVIYSTFLEVVWQSYFSFATCLFFQVCCLFLSSMSLRYYHEYFVYNSSRATFVKLAHHALLWIH